MAKKNKSNMAKKMVMQPCFRMRVEDDKTKKKKFNRKTKHKGRNDRDPFTSFVSQ